PRWSRGSAALTASPRKERSRRPCASTSGWPLAATPSSSGATGERLSAIRRWASSAGPPTRPKRPSRASRSRAPPLSQSGFAAHEPRSRESSEGQRLREELGEEVFVVRAQLLEVGGHGAL